MYGPLPKQPKFTTVAVPIEAIRHKTQATIPATPDIYFTANPTPPSLPIPPFPNEESPTPPSSPSPQTVLEAPARPLWPDHHTPITPAMDVDGPEPPQPLIQRPEEFTSPVPENSTPEMDPVRPLLRSIVTTNRDHGSRATAARNTIWDPIDKYNKSPMPKIHDANPTAIFDLIDLSVIDEWDSFPEGKLAAIPFGNEVNKLYRHDDIRRKIFNAAAEITKAQHAAVAGPRPHANARQNARPPHTFLIYNLSELQRRTLLERTVWSSAEITFRVAPLLPTKPDFLFSITGLSTLATDDVREMILNTWRKKETLIVVKAAIQTTDEATPTTNLRTLEDFLNTLEVKRLDIKEKKGALAPEFNVYAKADYIKDHNVWGDLHHSLATQQYHSTMLGRGNVRVIPFNCRICHGVDHPSGLCPFPNITEWKGPTGRESDEDTGTGNEGNRGPSPRQNRRWI